MSGWRKRDEEDSQSESGAAGGMTGGPAEPGAGFCSECGHRLPATAGYVPKFCARCGHRLAAGPPPASGLDALLQATAAAKSVGAAARNPSANVTLMGGSRTLMGAPRGGLYEQTLMGAPRADLSGPTPRARSGATRARIAQARRAGGKPTPTRRLPAPDLTRAPRPDPRPAPTPPPARRPIWEGAFFVFSLLLLLAVLAAAGAFWLARRGLLRLSF